jgi:two-component system, NarL family, nitrate/nitrite response regulator NarL
MAEPASKQREPIRVLIVDDHLTVLWGLERLIESSEGSMTVVGKAVDAAEALAKARTTLPDVILLDIGLKDSDAIDIIPELIASSGARVLVLTGERDPSVRERAVLAGACGVVGKEESPGNILIAITKVREGELWLDRTSTGRIFMQLSKGGGSPSAGPRDPKSRIALLTPRERQIARIVTTEPKLSLKEIAELQHISESTLRNHLTSIYGKLGVTSRLELYVYASEHALTE